MSLYYSTKSSSTETPKTVKPKKNPLDHEYYVAILGTNPETKKSYYQCVVFRSKSKDACLEYAENNFVINSVTTSIRSGSELIKLGMDEKYIKNFVNPKIY